MGFKADEHSGENLRAKAQLEEAISDDDLLTSCDFPIQKIDDDDNDTQFSLVSLAELTNTAYDEDIHTQLKRDIDMLSRAIIQYGSSEYDKNKARTLLKAVLLLYFGDISYRGQDKKFHQLCTLNVGPDLEFFPIAALLLHGSRDLIEFSSEIGNKLIEWFIPDQNSWRYMATHGIELVDRSECLEGVSLKSLKERKVNIFGELQRFLSQAINNNVYYPLGYEQASCDSLHYGIDIALGGAGNKNYYSNEHIQSDGEHGHLYLNYRAPKEAESGGLLISIEQSAPGKKDQYDGLHDMWASKKERSASGGSFFCKEGALKDLPIDDYYDSLWNFISAETFSLIEKSYTKLTVLIDLLSLDSETKDESLNLIVEIVSSSGNASRETFDAIYDRYYTKTANYKAEQEEFNIKLREKEAEITALQKEGQRLQQEVGLYTGKDTENQKKIQEREAEIATLIRKNESLTQRLEGYQLAETKREERVDKENETTTMKDLQELTIALMHTVSNNMGRFSKNSPKKIILTQLMEKLKTKKENELSKEAIVWLLKNFISVVIRNRYRYDKKGGETRSSKICLKLLNDPDYEQLKDILFSKQSSLVREDLFNILDANADPVLLTSARYRQSLYNAFGIAKIQKSIANEQLNLAMRALVYEP